MSFWNFLCGFALFNAVCDIFSGKSKQTYKSSHQYNLDYDQDGYFECNVDDIDDSDIDDLQARIDELEGRLADCDIMSDRYDELQDRIDELQERLDDIEDAQYMDDVQDEFDSIRYDLDDMDLELDINDDITDDDR